MTFSTRKPVSAPYLQKHINAARQCVEALVNGIGKGNDEWRVLSDVVNMSETFVTHKGGVWKGCDLKPVTLADTDGVINDGIGALAEAGMLHLHNGGDIRVCSKGAAMLMDLIDCYEEILQTLPHSEIEKCRNITNRRILEIQRGKKKDHDVVVVSA